MSLVTLGKKAQRIDIQKLALEEVKANSGLIAELNRQQLTVGENSKGKRIGKLVSDPYARSKKSRGGQAPFGVPDLNLFGNLYKKTQAKITPTTITITSTVPYDIYQEKRYGEEIHQLQDQNWEEVEFKVLVETRDKYLRAMSL